MERVNLEIKPRAPVNLDIGGSPKLSLDIKGASGTNYYPALIDKPSIESVTLVGDKTFKQLGLSPVTEQEIDKIIYGG